MPKPLSKETSARVKDGDRRRSASTSPDILIWLTPTLNNPFQLVVKSKHDFDWSTSGELLEMTEASLRLLGDLVLKGAWFLNPKFTVSSQVVSAVFFREARHARSQWLNETPTECPLQQPDSSGFG